MKCRSFDPFEFSKRFRIGLAFLICPEKAIYHSDNGLGLNSTTKVHDLRHFISINPLFLHSCNSSTEPTA